MRLTTHEQRTLKRLERSTTIMENLMEIAMSEYKSVFKVEYEEYWNGEDEEREFSDKNAMHVLAPDAERAIEKCRKEVVGQEVENEEDGTTDRVTGFRLLGVHRVCDVDA